MHLKRAALVATTIATLLLAALVIPSAAGASMAGSPTAARAGVATAALPAPDAAAARFVELVNALRTSKGLGPLAVDGELTTQANAWAATMASAGRIFHTSDMSVGITSSWAKLGENVGVGGDVDQLFQAFVDSPTHYDNLVDPEFTLVGIGVVVTADRIYTAHRFMAIAPPPPPPPPPPAPQVQPVAPPTTVAPTTTLAPTTTTPTRTAPTTTAPPAARPTPSKLGPVERIAALIERQPR